MAATGEILEQLTALSHHLGDPARDLAILGEGNTSARVDEKTFYIKASGHHLGSITAAGFCPVNFAPVLAAMNGGDLSDAEVKQVLLESKADGNSTVMPSVESFLHAYLLTLPHVSFIGHTHPIAVNSILCSSRAREAVSGRLFPDEIVCCGVAPCFVEYTDPGVVLAKLLRQRTEEFFDKYGEWPRTVLMQNHGFIALGRTPRDVESITGMYVKTARILIGTYAFGGPSFLSEDNVRRIHSRPDEDYRKRQIGRRA